MQMCFIGVAPMGTPVRMLVVHVASPDYSPVCIKNNMYVGLQELFLGRLVGKYHKHIAKSLMVLNRAIFKVLLLLQTNRCGGK